MTGSDMRIIYAILEGAVITAGSGKIMTIVIFRVGQTNRQGHGDPALICF
jgi:hypothetical protein